MRSVGTRRYSAQRIGSDVVVSVNCGLCGGATILHAAPGSHEAAGNCAHCATQLVQTIRPVNN